MQSCQKITVTSIGTGLVLEALWRKKTVTFLKSFWKSLFRKDLQLSYEGLATHYLIRAAVTNSGRDALAQDIKDWEIDFDYVLKNAQFSLTIAKRQRSIYPGTLFGTLLISSKYWSEKRETNSILEEGLIVSRFGEMSKEKKDHYSFSYAKQRIVSSKPVFTFITDVVILLDSQECLLEELLTHKEDRCRKWALEQKEKNYPLLTF